MIFLFSFSFFLKHNSSTCIWNNNIFFAFLTVNKFEIAYKNNLLTLNLFFHFFNFLSLFSFPFSLYFLSRIFFPQIFRQPNIAYIFIPKNGNYKKGFPFLSHGNHNTTCLSFSFYMKKKCNSFKFIIHKQQTKSTESKIPFWSHFHFFLSQFLVLVPLSSTLSHWN